MMNDSEMPEKYSVEELEEKLRGIRDLIKSRDLKGAIAIIDDCLAEEGQEGEPEDTPESKSARFKSALREAYRK